MPIRDVNPQKIENLPLRGDLFAPETDHSNDVEAEPKLSLADFQQLPEFYFYRVCLLYQTGETLAARASEGQEFRFCRFCGRPNRDAAPAVLVGGHWVHVSRGLLNAIKLWWSGSSGALFSAMSLVDWAGGPPRGSSPRWPSHPGQPKSRSAPQDIGSGRVATSRSITSTIWRMV